jgi:hypothetical protein
MKFALFVAEQKSDAAGSTVPTWHSFVRSAKDEAIKHGHGTRLNDGSYLLPLNAGMQTLSRLVLCAQEWSVQSRIAFFDQDPTWVISKIPAAD